MALSPPRFKTPVPAQQTALNGPIPPLQNGDHLTPDEFMRRYEAMPDLKKAELIEGVVHVSSPVRCGQHGEPHSSLGGWLFVYRARTPGLKLADNATVRLDMGNTPQPDNALFITPDHGGQAKVDEDDYISGAPELVAEVAASSASYDMHEKLQAYERNGVREYIIWRVQDREVDWFILRDQSFVKLPPETDGILRSMIFPGLWLDPSALISEDFDKLLDVLQLGLDSSEHADFVDRLRQARDVSKT